MNVLMISLDKGLLGDDPLGDVIERHVKYGKSVEALDIIVQTKDGFADYELSHSVHAYPTNSKTRLHYPGDSNKIAATLFKDKKYDLIITQDPFLTGLAGALIKQQLGGKLIIHLHGDYIDDKNWLQQKYINRLLQRFALYNLKRADAIRVVSGGIKEKLLKHGFPEGSIRVISTPIDLARFEKGIRKEKEWKKIITMVCRQDEIKDFPTLFAAMKIVFSKYNDAGLYLVGNYTDTAKVPLPKERIKLFGKVSAAFLPDIYATSDIVVLSSISESFGKVLVEAGASGKPVVATDTTGAKEVIRDGLNGYLVPIGDEEALAEKILNLLNDSDKAQDMGEQGRLLAKERYSKTSDNVVDFWNIIVNK